MPMDLKTLKLELLERIALIDDQTRLQAIKRVLDAPRGYGIPNEQLSVVKEGEPSADGNAARTFTWEDVQRILAEDRAHQRALQQEAAGIDISDDELALLDARRERHLKSETRSYTWQELEEILKNDLKR